MKQGGGYIKVITKEYPRDMDYLTLYPIGDVHWGAAECMEKEFQSYLKLIEADDHAAVITLGDLINNGVKSSVTNCYAEKYRPREQKSMMIDLLSPIRDKIICGVRGNHEYRTVKDADQDVMLDIFTALSIQKTAYASDLGLVKISVGEKHNRKPATYMFGAMHGSGGGTLLGSGLNKSDSMQMCIEGIDGMLSGHTHKPAKVPSARLVFDSHNNNVIRTKTLNFICTSWLNYGGYPERMMLRPTAFAPDTIRLDGRKKEWK